ncbi:MAG TPA: hypothetical protein V6D04_13530 [Candidatus Obscuribacterales bacterium]
MDASNNSKLSEDQKSLASCPLDHVRLHFTQKEGGGLFDVYIPSLESCLDKATQGNHNGQPFTALKLPIAESEYCVTESKAEIKQLILNAYKSGYKPA